MLVKSKQSSESYSVHLFNVLLLTMYALLCTVCSFNSIERFMSIAPNTYIDAYDNILNCEVLHHEDSNNSDHLGVSCQLNVECQLTGGDVHSRALHGPEI